MHLYDPRTDGMKPIKTLKNHKKAVLSISVDDTNIISASEDGTICVWNRKAGKIAKTLTVSLIHTFLAH